MRNLFKFKILQGVTIFGAGTAYIYKKNSESDSKIVDQKNLELQQQNQELKKDWTYHFISECLSEGIVLLIPLLRPPLNCLDHPVSRDLQKLRGIRQSELGHGWDDFCCGGRHV